MSTTTGDSSSVALSKQKVVVTEKTTTKTTTTTTEPTYRLTRWNPCARLLVITFAISGAFCSFKTVFSCNFVSLVEPVSLNLNLDISESTRVDEFAHPLFMSPAVYALDSNSTTSTIDSVIIDNSDVQIETITTTINSAVASSIGMFHYRIRLKQQEQHQYQRLDGSSSDPIVTNVSQDYQEHTFCQVYDYDNRSEFLVSPFEYPFVFAAQLCSIFAPICGLLALWILVTDWCCRTDKFVADEATQKIKKRQPFNLICTCCASCFSSELGVLLFGGAFQIGTFLIMWEPTFCYKGFGDDRSTTCQIFDLMSRNILAATMRGSSGGYFSCCAIVFYLGAFLVASCFGVIAKAVSRKKSSAEGRKKDSMGENKSTSGGLTPAASEEQDEQHGILPSSSSTTTSPTPTNFVVAFPDSKTVPTNVSYNQRHGHQVRRGPRGGRSISSRGRYPRGGEDVEMGVTHTSSNSTSDVSTTSSSSCHRQTSSRGSVASLRSKFMALDTVVESTTSPRYQESSTGSGFLFCNNDAEVASSSTRAPSPPPVIDQEWMDERVSSSGSDFDV